MQSREPLAHALAFNESVLRQARDLVGACEPSAFRERVGPHLRHVLEHYDEFLTGLATHVIDYDARVRDLELERDPAKAAARIDAIVTRLGEVRDIPETIAVSQQGGLSGDERFIVMSSPLRELLFVAGHAIHHFAILKPALTAAGVPVPPDFGKAPGTVQYERTFAW
jgi:hypothetical protein